MTFRILLYLSVLLVAVPSYAQGADELFLGRWTLHLPNGAGWLEVREENDKLDASLLWYGGSVLPVKSASVNGDKLILIREFRVSSESGEVTISTTAQLEMHLEDDRIVGVAKFPSGENSNSATIPFEGERLPDLPPAPDLSLLQYGEPVNLFNGRDLTGWSLINSRQKNGFKAQDGMLVNDPVQPENGEHISYGNLRTDATFEDFRLTLEVNVPEGSNSGVYLRGIYEIQVADTYGKPVDSHNMGGLYSRITPSVAAEKPAGEWQNMDITLYKRHLTVILNGTKIIDNQPVLGVTGGAMSADESAPGPIYLQGDHGHILYRNLVLTPIVGEDRAN